jgi:hypothetical protein
MTLGVRWFAKPVPTAPLQIRLLTNQPATAAPLFEALRALDINVGVCV